MSVCQSAGANGKSVTYNTSCTSNLFAWNTQQQSASSNKEGMICPGLLVSRPASVTNLSSAFYNNVVSSDPLLYSYQGCTCALPLVAHYTVDTAGMSCPQIFLKGSEQTQHLGRMSQHIGLCASRCSLSPVNHDGCLHALLQKLMALVLIPVCHKCLAVLQLMFAMQEDGSMCEAGDVMRV